MSKVKQYYQTILKRLKKDYAYKPGDNPPYDDDYLFFAPSGLEFALDCFYNGDLPVLVVEYAEEIGGQRSGFEDGSLFYVDDMSVDEMYQKIKAEIESATTIEEP